MLVFSVAYEIIMRIYMCNYCNYFVIARRIFKDCAYNTYRENESLCHLTHFEDNVGKYSVIESLSCANTNSLRNFAGGIFHPYVREEVEQQISIICLNTFILKLTLVSPNYI